MFFSLLRAASVDLLLQAGLTTASQNCSCSQLASKIDFASYNASFHNATYHAVGAFAGNDVSGVLSVNNVAFCELHAAINYTEGARLVFALWLPDPDSYQGRFLGIGNGGMAGTIHRENFLTQLNSGFGFAIAGGDAGHDTWEETGGLDNSVPGTNLPFLRHEERTKAWIQNAGSILTPLAKALTAKYYAEEPKHSYWNGCSAGGGQAFGLAEFHPDMYDGIFAGSPANYQSHMWLAILWTFLSQQGERALSAEVLTFVNNKALDLCDGLDGVQDRLIENPLTCPFDVGTLLCGSGQDPGGNGTSVACLTQAQIDALRAIYAGPKTADTNEQIYPGHNVGTEANFIIPVMVELATRFAVPILQNLVFENLTWDPHTFGYTSAEVAHVDTRGAITNAISTNLTPFRQRGGKMLTTMGWADPAFSPLWPIVHRERLRAALPAGEKVESFYRLFMVPGGGHCDAASFPQTPAKWHVTQALIDWVENGKAPGSVLATDPADGSGRSRRLCSWPATARFLGGDPDVAESFVCRED